MKSLTKIIFTICIFILFITKTEAISVSENNLTLEEGSNKIIELYANVDTPVKSITFTLIYTNNDVPANYTVNSSYTDNNPNGIKHQIVFTEEQSGKILLGTVKINVINNPTTSGGSVNIHSAQAITIDDQTVDLNSQTINVTINKTEDNNQTTTQPDNNTNTQDESKKENNQQQNEEKTDEKNEEEVENKEPTYNFLDKIESEIVKINIKDDVFEYKVNVKKDIEELDLKAIPKDEKYQVEITSQKISELKDNQIIITIKDNEVEQKYIINVNVLKDFEEIEIDEGEFKSTYNYKSKWVIVIVVLVIFGIAGLFLTKKKVG